MIELVNLLSSRLNDQDKCEKSKSTVYSDRTFITHLHLQNSIYPHQPGRSRSPIAHSIDLYTCFTRSNIVCCSPTLASHHSHRLYGQKSHFSIILMYPRSHISPSTRPFPVTNSSFNRPIHMLHKIEHRLLLSDTCFPSFTLTLWFLLVQKGSKNAFSKWWCASMEDPKWVLEVFNDAYG